MKKFLIPILIISFLACTKYEKIEDFPIESPMLVANSFFQEGEPFIISVSRSLSVLDNAPLHHLSDAEVILYRNQIAVDTIQGANEDIYYRSHIIPEKDYNYHIRVTHSRYYPIFSKLEKLPAPIIIKEFQCVLIDSVVEIYERWGSNRVDTLITSYVLDCSLTLLDQGVTENIYSIGIEKWDSITYSHYSGDRWARMGSFLLRSDDPSMINQTGIGSVNFLYDRIFFNNDLFAGKEYTFNFTVEDKGWGTTLHREYNLMIYSYSYSSYMYARSRNFGSLWQSTPFDEPNRVYTNIEGGYGIFAGIGMELIPLRR